MSGGHCRYHCRCCGGHFASLEAFDQHRPQSATAGGCEWPEDAPLVEIEGRCTIGHPDQPLFGVTLYSTERSERAREHFRGQNGRQTAPANVREAVLA